MGPGFSPLDNELGLLPGSLTPHLLNLLVRLSAWVPFAAAAQLLMACTACTVSKETARRQTEAAGAVLVAAQTAAAPALAPPADPGPPTADRLQLSADGAMVALTDGTWAEVKTCALARVVPEVDRTGQLRPRARDISYFSRLTGAEEFTRWAVVETHRRGVRAATAVAAINDGAGWLQHFVDYHCSDAVRILDLPHGVEHIANVARAAWGAEDRRVGPWVAAQATELKTHGPTAVLAAIEQVLQEHPHAASGTDLAYLRARVAQMDYPAFATAGWPLGSGVIESGNKLVVEVRLKGAGMRWERAAVNPVLGLRNAVCNDRWAETWDGIAGGLRAGARAQAAIRRAARTRLGSPAAGAPPAAGRGATEPGAVNVGVVAAVATILTSPPLVTSSAAAGERRRPAAHHPWRRSPIGKAAQG